MTKLATALAAHNLGWRLTPTNGKVPTLSSWQLRPMQSESDVREWIDSHGSVGVRTGHGFCILDVDPGSALEWADVARYPHTPIAATPRGGLHVYLVAPNTLGNSAGKLAEHVDIRGKGGQAVLYDEWIVPMDTPMAPIPPEWLEILEAAVTKERKALAALRREAGAVRDAVEGTRNDTLNRAAFNLGQLVRAGAIDELSVRSELEAAALAVGLSIEEAGKTIDSGLRGGAQKPREARKETPPPEPRKPLSGKILTPGSHSMPGGSTVAMSSHEFVEAVLAALPAGTLYRRESLVGTIVDDRFAPIGPHALRKLVDQHLRLETWKVKGKEPVCIYTPCSLDHANLILDAAGSSHAVRALRSISAIPVVTRDRRVLGNGWHEEFGLLVTWVDRHVEPISPFEVTCDVVWDSEVSKANFLCMLGTPFVVPALGGNRPLFAVTAAQHGVGKSKLIDEVCGTVWFNGPMPMDQFPEKEEEVAKTILAHAISGQQAVCLDNMRSQMDSPALASYVTAGMVSGRVLGASKTVSVPNVMTLIVTGTHLEASSELARRCCIVGLGTTGQDPELRTGWRYPDMRTATAGMRDGIIAWMVQLLTRPGKPQAALGSFEAWNDLMVGSVQGAGYPAMQDRAARIAEMDDGAQDLAKVLERMAMLSERWVSADDILPIVKAVGAWPVVFRGANEHAHRSSLGRILRRYTGVTVGGRTLVRTGTGSARWYGISGT